MDESLNIWQRKRARADNISAIVVFLDDEFKTWSDDEDNESISSEADTVIMTNGEDDTPPMSSSENLSSLVRQIALPFSPSARPSSSDTSGTSTCNEIENIEETETRGEESSSQKRKLRDSTNELASKAKKARTIVTPPQAIVEDSHQCNVITVLSAESLVDLQLDEDLGFVDEDSDCNIKGSNVKRARSLEEGPLKFSPIPQAAK